MSEQPQREQYSVQFEPSGRRVTVDAATSLSEAAGLARVAIDFPCGHQGNCGKCRVQVQGDSGTASLPEHIHLTQTERDAGLRLACQVTVNADLTVIVPEQPHVTMGYKILVDASAIARAFHDPVVRILRVAVPAPTLDDDRTDWSRLLAVTGLVEADIAVLRIVRKAFAGGCYEGTAVLSEQKLIDYIPGDRPVECYGAAFDIGTTTLVARLLCLRTGKEVARTARLNPQVSFGADVLSRILYASHGPANLAELHAQVRIALREMLDEMLTSTTIAANAVYGVTVAGNSVMQHLFAGLDPAPIGRAPFVSATNDAMTISATDIGLRLHPRAECYIFPAIAGYVGGDIVAGLVATGFADSATPALFVDIGTNGEMVVRAWGQLIATSCAAGPAFEGAGITHGMRATSGAIEHVRLDDRVYYTTVGTGPAIGICGSGLIDLVAELLRVGLLSESGQFATTPPPGCPIALTTRLREVDDSIAFIVVEGFESPSGRSIALFERDIAELRLATASIRSGIEILLRRAKLDYSDLGQVLVAGAFGNYVHCENAQRIGVLPTHIDSRRIEFVGNSSLEGARLALMSLGVRTESARLAREIEHVDLSLDPAFHETFVDALVFPEIL